jgi:hypothetical protein
VDEVYGIAGPGNDAKIGSIYGRQCELFIQQGN